MSEFARDYVEVAERLQEFIGKYPEGSLQFEIVDYREMPNLGLVVVGKAYAYRSPDDLRPGIGWAQEVIPGRTSFTKGSEISNLETSCWGRAMAALGIATKRGIATGHEVRQAKARQQDVTQSDAPPTTQSDAPADGLMAQINVAKSRAELQDLVDTIAAQPDPAPYQAAARTRWGKVR